MPLQQTEKKKSATDVIDRPRLVEPTEAEKEDEHHALNNTLLELSDNMPAVNYTQSAAEEKARVIYSDAEKWLIAITAATASVFSAISSPIYLPALPTLEKYFHTDTEKLNLTVTIYTLFQGISPMFWGSVSDVFGRRPVLLACFLFYMGANIGLALSESYSVLFGMRILQAFGAASTVAIAGGIVGDITTRRNRGTYLGAVTGIGILGNCFGPLIGGGIAGGLGWRAIFWFLLIASGAQTLLIILLLPETSHVIAGDGSKYPEALWNRSPYIYFRAKRTGIPQFVKSTKKEAKSAIQIVSGVCRTVIERVYRSFRMLLEPDFIFVLIPAAFHYTAWFMSLTALSSLLSTEYGFGVTQIGCSYLSSGIGATAGSIVSGKLLSWRYKKRVTAFRTRCLEKQEPVDMAKFSIIAARTELLPIYSGILVSSILVFGWTIKYRVHYVVPIIMTFFTSYSAVSFITGVTALLVDLIPEESASANACVNLCRCVLCAIGLAVVDKMINGIGAGWTFTIVGLISLVSMVFIYLCLHYGESIARRRQAREKQSA